MKQLLISGCGMVAMLLSLALWGPFAVIVAAAVNLAVIIACGAVSKWREAGRRIEEARNEVQADTAVTMTCDPCHGRPGRCTCSAKCGNPACGAPDTGISDWDAELRELLGRDGGQP